MKKFTIVIERNKDGYWGQIQEYPEVFCYGTSLDEIKSDAEKGLMLYSEEMGDTKMEKPRFELLIDLQEFFKINDFINITKLAKRTGMNTSLLRQYAKGLKFPSVEQVGRIEKTIREIGAELLNTHLLNKPIKIG